MVEFEIYSVWLDNTAFINISYNCCLPCCVFDFKNPNLPVIFLFARLCVLCEPQNSEHVTNYLTCIFLLFKLGLHQISAPALANLKSGHFSQIRPNQAPAEFLAGFGSCSAFS